MEGREERGNEVEESERRKVRGRERSEVGEKEERQIK